MRGRKPQPDAVRSQKDPVRSTRKRAAPAEPAAAAADQVAAPAAGAVDPPAWLQADGLKIWQRLAPTLRAAKLLSEADTQAFGRYCRNFARWLKLQDELDREGETYETETYISAGEGGAGEGEAPQRANKLKRAHPAFVMADRIERQLLAAEDRFGLNPAERQRIFAARAQTGVPGDLFTPDPKPPRRPGDPAAQATPPAQPIENPVGFLN